MSDPQGRAVGSLSRWAGLWTNADHGAPTTAVEFHTTIHPFICSAIFKEHLLVPMTFQTKCQMRGHSRKEIQVLVSRRTQTKRPHVVGPGLSCELCDPEQMIHVFWSFTSSVGTVAGLPRGVD